MSRRKEIITTIGTLTLAVSIGFVMQSSEKAQDLYGTKPVSAEELKTSDAENVLEVQAITLTSASLPVGAPSAGIALPDADDEIVLAAAPQTLEPPAEPAPLAEPVPACSIEAEATALPAAMVALSMTAACLPNERVTVHHNGLILTHTTDAEGVLDVRLPALSQDAVFVLAFANGEGALAEVSVPELEDFDRVVLQWKGQAGFEIHAREFGAAYGEEGHIWAGATRNERYGIDRIGGFLTRHGDTNAADPLLAEVYSFPKVAAVNGTVELSVEAEITNANCDLEIEAQTLEMRGLGQIKAQDLTLSVPECSSVGDFLVLNNLLQDLKVATN